MCSSWRDNDWPRVCGNRATCSIMRTVYMYIDGMPVRVCLSDRGHISGIHVQCSSTVAEQPTNLCQNFAKFSTKVDARIMPSLCTTRQSYRDYDVTAPYVRDGHGSIFLHPTQPNPSTYGPNPTHDANTRTQPNPPITHLREMQTPVL